MTVKQPVSLRSMPILGNVAEMNHDRLAFLLQARRLQGDVARFQIFGRQIYLLSCPDDIKHVLQDNYKAYVKGRAYDRIKAVLGNGLLTSSGELWLHQRRLIQPAFHRQKIMNFAGIMVDAANTTIERLLPFAKSGEPVDLHAEMMRLTLTVVARALFSVEVGDVAEEVRTAMASLLENSLRRIQRPFELPLWLPIPEVIHFRQSLQTLDKIVYKIIGDRHRDGKDHDDLLSMLLNAVDEETGQKMNDRQLRDEVMTLFLAGHETTANALSWAWMQLSKVHQVEERLELEISSVLHGRDPAPADLPALPYNKNVIDEVLRLFPPAYTISRTSITEDEVSGVRIPPQSVVLVSPYVTHRHPQFWPNPEGFDPDRFTPEASAGRPPFAYFPFGGGPRLCIGNNFALMEAQLVLAALVQRFRFELLPDYPVIMEPTITLRPKYGLWFKVIAR